MICLLFVSFTFNVHSQNSNAELVHNTPVSIDLGKVGGYLEHLPPGYDNDTTRKYPLLVYLHGRGERGNGASDLYKISNQARTSPTRHAEAQGSLCFTVNGAEECFILLSPQLSSGNWTAFSQENFWNYILNDSNYRIDTNRVYLTGFSLGGNGAWEAAYDRNTPNKFAAIAPLAAWGNPSKACVIADKKIPVWAFHGTNDQSMNFNAGLHMFNAVAACPGDPSVELKFTPLEGAGHNIVTPVYRIDNSNYSPNLYEWLLSKSKAGAIADTIPNAPDQLSSISESASTVQLEWRDNAVNETGFTIERSLVAGSGYDSIASVAANVTSFIDMGLSASTTYFYRVRAYNILGNSVYSNELMISTTAIAAGTPITWTNINGAVQVGGDLVKTAGYGWGNSGAESVESIPANTDGWVEMVLMDSMKTDLAFGLSAANVDDNLETINYGFQLSRSNGNLWIRENATRTYIGKFNEGDTLRVERAGDAIDYQVNGTVIASTHSAATSDLVADAALLRTGATVFQGRIYAGNSGGASSRTSALKNYFEIGQEEQKTLFKMYPNPLRLQNKLKVFLGETDFANEVELVAYDNLGKLVYQQDLDQTVSEIDMSHLGGAVYFIKVLSNGLRIASGRLLKINE